MSPDPKLGAGPTIFLANMHVSWSIGSSRTGEGAMAKTRMILLGGLAIVAVAVGTVAVRTANFAPANLADGSDVTLAAAPAYDLDAAVRHLSAAAQIRTISHRSEEHTSELQSLMRISYAVFCLKKKTTQQSNTTNKYHN